ncbi:MAG: cytochrome P450 [Myxococcota bacterium]|nr:cytochrome P450 [Myxococcota bacterium]
MASPPTKSASQRLFDPAATACPHAVYTELLDTEPVSRMPISEAAIISRYEDVLFALRNPEIFSSQVSEKLDLGTDRPMIPQQIDPPEQTRYRKLLDPFFSRRRMKTLEPAIRLNAANLIEGFLDSGHCEFNKQFAIPFPAQAFLHLFGLPMDDLSLFLQLKDDIIRPQQKATDPFNTDEINSIRSRAGRKIYDYFGELIQVRRKAPREDLMSSLVRARIDGNLLSEEEILDICYLQILAGLDTVTATLGCQIAYLAANPEQQKRLYERPDQIEEAVEELLRWETPVTGVPRIVMQDTEIAGTTLHAGEMVMLLLGAANIDPREFDRADQVEFDRPRNRHIAFGGGHHRCLGSHLARLELCVALEEWHARVDSYRIPPGETPTYSPGIREVQYLPLAWG